jgi:GTP-binding protein
MVIALAGRPNVGKSSLFNRLIGRRRSIVWDRPGVTRDLVRGEWKPSGYDPVEVWDLAGVGKAGVSISSLDLKTSQKIDLVLLVIDGSEPLTSEDYDCIQGIRKLSKPIVVAVNKLDRRSFESHSEEILRMFSKNIVEISAESKSGLSELQDKLIEVLGLREGVEKEEVLDQQAARKVLIMGRPNVGKSSLLNALSKDSVSFVADQPGTTRDIVYHDIRRKGSPWVFLDTAGIRKKPKVYGRKADPVEIFSVEKSLQELRKSDFALFVVEAQQDGQFSSQDRKLLHLVRSSMIPTMVVVNKWDLVRKTWTEEKYRDSMKAQLGDLHFLPILFASAKTGYRLEKVFQILMDLEKSIVEIPTPKLNRWLKKILEMRPPRVAKRGQTSEYGRSRTQYLSILYMVQTSKRPMTFQFFCNAPQAVAEEDRRFLGNQLRREFHLLGVPLKFVFRKKAN